MSAPHIVGCQAPDLSFIRQKGNDPMLTQQQRAEMRAIAAEEMLAHNRATNGPLLERSILDTRIAACRAEAIYHGTVERVRASAYPDTRCRDAGLREQPPVPQSNQCRPDAARDSEG
ncbi:MAG: hypothetical protein ACLGIM_02840 [Alphaproteobacteria bacterium]